MNTTHIPWHLLQSFAAISEAGSLSAGAIALGSSQPTLSRHIAQLEELLVTSRTEGPQFREDRPIGICWS